MLHPIMDDPQDRSAEAYCQHCGAELWGSDAEPDCGGKTLCPQCREDLAETEHRKEMITAVLEAADQENKKYLSDDVCDIIWNRLVSKFGI